MRRTLMVALGFLLAACHADPSIDDPPSSSFDDRVGAEIFVSYCAPCHGEEGRGDGAYLSADAPASPPDLSAPDVRGRITAVAVEARLRDANARGEIHCPPWGATLSTEEIAAVARAVEAMSRTREVAP